MKNLILTTVLGIILLTGCSRDDSIELIENQTTNSSYVLYQLNDIDSGETIVLDEFQRTGYFQTPITAHTEGYYLPSYKNAMTITWSGTQYADGSRKGRAELIQISPDINFHFILDTECIMAEDNEAVYGGTIIEVKSLYGGLTDIDLGWRFYFKVIDSKHSGNNSYDKIANITMFASPRSPSLCGIYPPSNIIWSLKGYSKVIEPGFVVVSSNVIN